MKPFKIMSYINIKDLDELLDMRHISDAVNTLLEEASSKTNIHELDGWTITFLMMYTHANNIRIFKRAITYKSEKDKQFTISTPIPKSLEAQFGLPEQYFFEPSHYKPINEKNCLLLNPNYAEYNSLIEYVIDAAKRAIDEAFKVGLTVNGKKLQYRKNHVHS